MKIIRLIFKNSLASISEKETESTATNIHLKKIKLKNLDIHTLDEATNSDVEKIHLQRQRWF